MPWRTRLKLWIDRLRLAGYSLEYKAGEAKGKTIASIFEAVAEPHLIQPTIIYDFPLAVSPLSKQNARRSGLGRTIRVLYRWL